MATLNSWPLRRRRDKTASPNHAPRLIRPFNVGNGLKPFRGSRIQQIEKDHPLPGTEVQLGPEFQLL
jgi:hypothetical protein